MEIKTSHSFVCNNLTNLFTPDRLKHSQSVARLMYQKCLEETNDNSLALDMFELGLLHDIGYSLPNATAETHNVLGGEYLSSLGYKYAKEVSEHGTIPVLESYELRLLNTADMLVSSDGSLVTMERRLQQTIDRYGEDSMQVVNMKNMLYHLKSTPPNKVETDKSKDDVLNELQITFLTKYGEGPVTKETITPEYREDIYLEVKELSKPICLRPKFLGGLKLEAMFHKLPNKSYGSNPISNVYDVFIRYNKRLLFNGTVNSNDMQKVYHTLKTGKLKLFHSKEIIKILEAISKVTEERYLKYKEVNNIKSTVLFINVNHRNTQGTKTTPEYPIKLELPYTEEMLLDFGFNKVIILNPAVMSSRIYEVTTVDFLGNNGNTISNNGDIKRFVFTCSHLTDDITIHLTRTKFGEVMDVLKTGKLPVFDLSDEQVKLLEIFNK